MQDLSFDIAPVESTVLFNTDLKTFRSVAGRWLENEFFFKMRAMIFNTGMECSEVSDSVAFIFLFTIVELKTLTPIFV
jgi:hypothetical protein